MAHIDRLIAKLTAIADAIRERTGKKDRLPLDDMPDAIRSISGGGGTPLPWGGMNGELISEYSRDFTLADTLWVKGTTGTTSNTVVTLRAAESYAYNNTTGSPTVAYGDKDIVVVQTVNVDAEYDGKQENANLFGGASIVHVTWLTKRKTSDTSAKTTRQAYPTTTNTMVKYRNSSGAWTRVSQQYGFYAAPSSASVASSTAASTYVRINSPTLSCRSYASYQTPANMRCVDAVTWRWNVKVYTVDQNSTPALAMTDAQDEWLKEVT